MMSLVNDSLKFNIKWYANMLKIFYWKNVSSFCSAKATHILAAKNIRILYIESAKIVNEMTLNELVKLMTLWTTGSRLPDVQANFSLWWLHISGDTLSQVTTHIWFCGEIRKRFVWISAYLEHRCHMVDVHPFVFHNTQSNLKYTGLKSLLSQMKTAKPWTSLCIGACKVRVCYFLHHSSA